jgi:hypothetical protein
LAGSHLGFQNNAVDRRTDRAIGEACIGFLHASLCRIAPGLRLQSTFLPGAGDRACFEAARVTKSTNQGG